MTNYNTKNIRNEELSVFMLKLVLTPILILYLSIMVYFSLIPGDELVDTLVPEYSVILHFLEFLGLSIILLLCFPLYASKYTKTYIASMVVFMALITEAIQYFVPGRFFSSLDIAVNLSGGLLLSLIIYIVSSKNKNKNK